MAKIVDDSVLDGALNIIKNNVTAESVCSTQPTTRTEAITTYMLATKTISGSDVTGPANGDTSGRKITMNQQAAISITNSGTAQHVALTSGTVLLYVTTCTSQALTSGNTVTVPAWDIEIADPS
jgi:hypothetical protein